MMAGIRERLEAFWSWEKPDRIPFTIYQNEWRHTAEDPGWQPLFQRGLGVTWWVPTYKMILSGVDSSQERYVQDGRPMLRRVLSTPLGKVSATWLTGQKTDDWPVKYYLETARDYRVMEYVVAHTELVPGYQHYLDFERSLPGYAAVLVDAGYSPIQKIVLDWAGLERFSEHLFECPSEVEALYQALKRQFIRMCEIIADGPGRFVDVLESFSADMLGPPRSQEYLFSLYDECFPMIRQSGKQIGCHFDGKTAACKEMIRKSPFDLLESLTPPPEGDLTLGEARLAWPDKLIWANINVSSYNLPAPQLHDRVIELASQAAPDGRGLGFEISEQYPFNWKESIPVILDALEEY
ncbi:MAG: hypothetical protein ACM3PY_20370 [Omnitrophica WOR_2 bacterium]